MKHNPIHHLQSARAIAAAAAQLLRSMCSLLLLLVRVLDSDFSYNDSFDFQYLNPRCELLEIEEVVVKSIGGNVFFATAIIEVDEVRARAGPSDPP